MNTKFKKVIALILRVTIGGIFVYASLYKINSPGDFAHQIYNYKILAPWMINPLAIILPALQLLCGLGLITNCWSSVCNALILSMLVVFQAAVASALLRHLDVSCGCFKAGGDPASWFTFARDSLLLVAVLINQWFLRDRNGNH